jgi:methylmalonyl-CoA mutase N-terminal domain/subunit
MFEKETIEKISESKKQWEEKVLKKSLSKAPESKEEFKSGSGEKIERLYTPEDVADIDYASEIGFPGQYPFTRGPQPTMYRCKPWTMRMYAGFATAEESNNRYKYLVSQGSTGLSVAFDLPTQIGYDSDHSLAQ